MTSQIGTESDGVNTVVFSRIKGTGEKYLISQGRRQLREIGGGKIKIRGAKLKTSVEFDPNFHYS